MTKEHKRMIKKSLKQMQREEEVRERGGAILAGIATWIIWFAIFFA